MEAKIVDPKRRATEAAMTPETRAVYARLVQLRRTENKGVLLIAHDVGVTVGAVLASEATFGTDALRQLATVTGSNDGHLYELVRFAQGYPRASVEAWSVRRTATGGWITLAHLLAILVIKRQQDRLEMVERVFNEGLTVRRLNLEIERLIGGPRSDGDLRSADGRPSRVGRVHRVIRDVKQLQARLASLAGSDDAPVATTAEAGDGILADKEREARQRLAGLRATIDEGLGRLRRDGNDARCADAPAGTR